jgi:high frequency lysogenization protein
VSKNLADSVLGLAGVFQAAELVRQIALRGSAEPTPMQTSLGSLLKVDAASVEDVYGGLEGVRLGLRVLRRELENREIEAFSYVLKLLTLEKMLSDRPDLLRQVGHGVEQAILMNQDMAVTAPQMIAHLAAIYQHTLSTFRFRIQVQGERRYLEQEANAAKVRALLLAGVRSAMLWRQKGGWRLQMLFSRGKLIRAAQAWLEQLDGA